MGEQAGGRVRPFVDGPPGSEADVLEAARAAAAHWSLDPPALLRIGMNGIFTAGGVVLRVGRVTAPASAAIELAEVLAAAGVRVPEPAWRDAVSIGPLTVTAWERLELIDVAPDWRTIGTMVRRVHELDRAAIPAAYPVPRGAEFPWWQFDELLAEVDDLLDPRAREGLVAAVERNRWWSTGEDHGGASSERRSSGGRPLGRLPDGAGSASRAVGGAGGGRTGGAGSVADAPDVVCHGDVHPGNVAMTPSGPVLLDWDLLCSGPPGWDHAALLGAHRWGYPATWYDDFATGYGRSLADDPRTKAIAELRLVAATLMRLRAGRADPAAMPEAQHRLAYWRGDPHAGHWHAV